MKSKLLLFLLIFVMAALTFIISGSQVHARVSGSCATCHTMHNSQNGAPVRGGYASVETLASPECAMCHADLRPGLLKMDCLGCHAENPNGTNNISPGTGAPQVAHGGADLAAGNYKHVFSGQDSKGHNVHGFFPSIAKDWNMMTFDPPGYEASLDYGGWNPNGVTQNPLMCAGTNGCHGNRSEIVPLKAIRGAHHADDGVLKSGGGFSQGGQGSTVGTSYRFLLGVHGGESSDWEKTFAANNHNEYRGAAWGSRGSDPRSTHSISSLCSSCHGAFHEASGVGTGASPWVRHPTDYGMKTTGEFASYTYNQQSPVARVTLHNPPDANVGTEDDRIVMCLSCHRAHATPNNDSLRWAYDDTMLTPNGCYSCHRNK